MWTSLPVHPDAHEVAVVLGQPRVHLELLRELTPFRHGPVVVRARDVWRSREDADFVFHSRSRIRNQDVAVLRPVWFHLRPVWFHGGDPSSRRTDEARIVQGHVGRREPGGKVASNDSTLCASDLVTTQGAVQMPPSGRMSLRRRNVPEPVRDLQHELGHIAVPRGGYMASVRFDPRSAS